MKFAAMAVIACVFSTEQAKGQADAPALMGGVQVPDDPNKAAKIEYYNGILQGIVEKIKALHESADLNVEFDLKERPDRTAYNERLVRIRDKNEQLKQLQREIMSGESKKKILQMKVSRIESDLEKTIKATPHDPVANALQKLLEIDEAGYQQMKQLMSEGRVSTEELRASERRLAESRLELAKHQWEQTTEARKALSAATLALEEAVFEYEVKSNEFEIARDEATALVAERIHLDNLVEERSELLLQMRSLETLISSIQANRIKEEQTYVKKIAQSGLKPFSPDGSENKTESKDKPSGK
jgi:hypothetical protein